MNVIGGVTLAKRAIGSSEIVRDNSSSKNIQLFSVFSFVAYKTTEL
jgi:hypothetical protein